MFPVKSTRNLHWHSKAAIALAWHMQSIAEAQHAQADHFGMYRLILYVLALLQQVGVFTMIASGDLTMATTNLYVCHADYTCWC